MGGWTVGKSDNKANSVQLLLQLSTGTELGKRVEIDTKYVYDNLITIGWSVRERKWTVGILDALPLLSPLMAGGGGRTPASYCGNYDHLVLRSCSDNMEC